VCEGLCFEVADELQLILNMLCIKPPYCIDEIYTKDIRLFYIPNVMAYINMSLNSIIDFPKHSFIIYVLLIIQIAFNRLFS